MLSFNSRQTIPILVNKIIVLLICSFLFCSEAATGRSDKTKKPAPQAGDRITLVSGATPIPLPAELIEIVKGKATVKMLPSFQYKGGERIKVPVRQIKAVFHLAPDIVPNLAPNLVPNLVPDQNPDKDLKDLGKGRPLTLQGNARAGERTKILSGLFTRFGQTFEGKNLVCREEHFYFYPDGRVYHGVPKEGPANFDWAKALAQNPALCGSYGIDGDTIIFNWPQQQSISWTIKRKGANIELNGLVADKAPEFSGVLAGTYTRQSVRLVDGKSIMTPVTYSFSKPNLVYYSDCDRTNSGHYLLDGNNLTIKFQSGSTFSCFVYPRFLEGRKNNSPEQIYLDGNIYRLVQLQKNSKE